MIHRFCITHLKPLLPASWYDDCIALGEFQADSALHVRQLDPFWHEARPIAFGAAGMYVVPIAVNRFAESSEFVEICSYRKRLLPHPEGAESQSYGYPTMRELSLDNFQKEEELATFIPKPDVGFLVAQPLYFEDSILGQYATSHHRGDILDYAALAVELGVLSPESATKFFDAKHFIPGGIEFGIYPKDWLVQTLSKVELVSRKFLQRFGNRVRNYDTYQVRAVGFLSERLGSFLLLNHLVDQYSNTIPAEIFGYMTVITEGSCGYSVAATDRSKGLFNLASIRQKRIQ